MYPTKPNRSFLYLCLLLSVLTVCQPTTEPLTDVVACAPMLEGRTSAIGFSVGGKCYVLGGRKSDGTYTNTLFCYDPATNQWTDCGETPLRARVKGIAAVQGEKVYVGLGYAGEPKTDSTHYLRDWWLYSPSDNIWKRCADYPSKCSNSPIVMADDHHLFVGWGVAYQERMTREIYRYDPLSDQWTRMKEEGRMTPERVQAAVGSACQERYFVGTGHRHDSKDTWYEMLPTDKAIQWKKCAHIPFGGRCLSTITTAKQYLYLFGGRKFGGTLTDGKVYQDILRYDTQGDQWQYVAALPSSETENMIAVTVGETVFFGGGNDKYNTVLNGWYKLLSIP